MPYPNCRTIQKLLPTLHFYQLYQLISVVWSLKSSDSFNSFKHSSKPFLALFIIFGNSQKMQNLNRFWMQNLQLSLFDDVWCVNVEEIEEKTVKSNQFFLNSSEFKQNIRRNIMKFWLRFGQAKIVSRYGAQCLMSTIVKI